MAKLTKDDILKAVEKMTVSELSELVKALEEKFGVSAQPVASVAPATLDGEDKSDTTTEQTTFNVVLAEVGANKISVIKAVREIVPTLGLQEAKTLVESVPKEILTGVNKKSSQEAKQKLEAAGGKVELK